MPTGSILVSEIRSQTILLYQISIKKSILDITTESPTKKEGFSLVPLSKEVCSHWAFELEAGRSFTVLPVRSVKFPSIYYADLLMESPDSAPYRTKTSDGGAPSVHPPPTIASTSPLPPFTSMLNQLTVITGATQGAASFCWLRRFVLIIALSLGRLPDVLGSGSLLFIS